MSHGIPVAILFVCLLWRSLPWRLNSVSVLERSTIALLLILLSVSWAIFYFIRIKVLHEICILPIFITALAFVFGSKTVWQHRMLLLLPIYIIPFGEFFNDYLVNLSSLVVSALVKLANIPAYIDGNSIQIPSGRIVIAQGCSGLRYLTIALCLAHTISYLNGYKERGLMVCLMAAGLLGLIANWLRIFILICIGYLTEMKSPLMADHDTFGWLLFGGICLTAIYFAPIVKASHEANQLKDSGKLRARIFFILLGLLAIAPLLTYVTAIKVVTPLKPLAVNSNYRIELGAMPVEPLLSKSTRHYLYRSTDDIYIRLDEFVPYTTHSQLVPYIPHLFNEEKWTVKKSARVLVNNQPASWKVLYDKNNEKIVGQIQWFNVGGYEVETINKAKLYQIPAVLRDKIYFKVITLQSVCNIDTCEDAYDALARESKNEYWH
jgi:exosortase